MKLFKNALFSLLLGTFAAGLLLKSTNCIDAAETALQLCARTLIPTLFPFFVLSSLLVSCGGADLLGRALRGIMRPLFSLGGGGGAALALGLLSGYPTGARTVGELYLRGDISRAEGEQLLSFCNNAGPGFLLGFCGAGIFKSTRIGAYLYLVHVCAALLSGILLRRKLPLAAAKRKADAPFGLVSSFPRAVSAAFSGILNVCAFVVLFMVLIRILSLFPPLAALPPLPRAALFGAIELTNGIAALPPTREGFVLCAAIASWGGLSVHAQALATLEGTGLPLHRYFLGKALQTLLSIPLALLVSARLW